MNDLKYALRSLLRRPGFTVVAVITLAIGMGAATAIFSVVDAVLLRPMPYPHQERIVEIRELDETGRGMPVADPNFDDLRTRARSFEALAKYNDFPEAVAGGHEPLRVNVCAASADFFRVLGVSPHLGRLFFDANSGQVAVVSYSFWHRDLGGAANLEGVTLRFGNRTFAVIGVLPPGTEFPQSAEIWFPAETLPHYASRTAHNWAVAGRLKPDVSLQQGRVEVATIGHALKGEHGPEIDAVSFGATALRERVVKDVRGVLVVLCGAVGVLLVLAASNVTNLLLVRATVRRKEMAVRAALGASRPQLARQFIIESMLVAVGGAAAGAVFAFWGIDLIVGLYHGKLPQVGAIGINSTTLLFSLTIAGFLGLVLGLVPTLHVSANRLQNDLQDTGRAQSASRTNRRVRNGLVVAQIALTLTLLVGGGLLARSFQRLLATNPGFQTESAVAMTVSMPQPETPEANRQLAQFYQQLLARLQSLPGIISIGGINALPMSGMGANGTFLIENSGHAAQTLDEYLKELTALRGTDRTGSAWFRVATAGYFPAMQITLRRGRLFQESDGPDNPHVALISESLARRYFANTDPIGQQIQFGNMDGDLHLLSVVGVVGDVRDRSLDAEPQPILYVNCLQRPGAAAEFSFVARAKGNAAGLIDAMRREARAANPEMPIKFRTLEQLVSSSLNNRRFSMVMVGVFAGAALLLAMIGLYGMMAYVTAERTVEVGIRMALGAQRIHVLAMILRQSLGLVLLGVAFANVAALAGTRLLASLLYGVSALDFLTYAAVIFLLALAAFAASYFPARRATKVDPVVALRCE